MRRLLCALALALGACGGEAPPSDRDLDGARDAIDCAPDDPTIYPGADDTCDGHDSNCNNIVDDGLGVAHELTYYDEDGDGYGVLAGANYQGCLREHWISASDHPDVDCNDANASVTPLTPGTCDYDHDGALGAIDCDDHDFMRKPGNSEQCNGFDDDCDGTIDDADVTPPFAGRGIYVLDADHDGYPSTSILACTPPGGGYEEVTVVAETDCAPSDPLVHPNQPDDCATMTDRDCDGVFRRVHIADWQDSASSVAAARAAFTASGAGQAPETIALGAYGDTTISLCPGTYRVNLSFGGWGLDSRFVVKGLGANPGDVVLDGGGAGRVVDIRRWINLDQDGPTSARLENVTIANGHSTDSGGCLRHESGAATTPGHPTLELDHVAFTGCTASRGGALHAGVDASLTSTTFAASSATDRGGAISFEAFVFSMTGGGFTGTSAPSGNAIAATLYDTSTFSLSGVDLSSVANDIAVTIGANTITRDLGANASLACDASGCTP